MSKRRSKDDDDEVGTCYKRFKARTYVEPQHDEEMIYLRALLRQHCEKQNIDFTTSKVRSLSSSSSSSSCSSYSALSPLSSNLQSDSSFSDSSVNVSSDNVNNVGDETSDGDQNAGNKCDENCSSSTATAEYDTCIGGPDLLSLSDDVLLIILKYLHPFDLLNISRTCVRLNIVSRDRTLWTDIDFRHDINDKRYMKKVIDFDNFIKFLLPTTKSIKKNGSTKYEYAEFACTTTKTTQMSITASFFAKVSKKVKALKSFTLENHTVYGPATTLECFPSSLEHLSLKNSLVVRLPSDKSYFFKIDKVLPYLTVLDLSGCQWFQSHSFLALSKSPTLKELHLRGCLGIQDCVPYASLAATFGFPALELLDLRLTHVNDSDVSCFNRVEKLKKLYLEAVDWSDSSNKITDVGVASFGNGTTKLNENFVGLAFVLIRNQRPSECSLESIVLRNYRCVTDISLKHAAVCLPNLKHLDVSGTSCTIKGVREFKVMRPNVELLSDFNEKELLATNDE